VKLLDVTDLVDRTHYQRNPLMKTAGGDIENALTTRRGTAAGLFHDERHWMRLINQA
jgi:hypothetical protein